MKKPKQKNSSIAKPEVEGPGQNLGPLLKFAKSEVNLRATELHERAPLTRETWAKESGSFRRIGQAIPRTLDRLREQAHPASQFLKIDSSPHSQAIFQSRGSNDTEKLKYNFFAMSKASAKYLPPDLKRKTDLDLDFLNRKRSGLGGGEFHRKSSRCKELGWRGSRANWIGVAPPNSGSKCCTTAQRTDKLAEDIRFSLIYAFDNKKELFRMGNAVSGNFTSSESGR